MKIQRTDAEWRELLVSRAARLHKFTQLMAPSAVMEAELWMVYDAMHKGSAWSKVRQIYQLTRADIIESIRLYWRLKVLRMDPEDDKTWLL